MSRFKISIEDDSSTTNPDVIAAVAEIPETQVEVEKSAADVAMQSGDVATCVSDIETAQNNIGTLSDIQQVLVEASTKTEGIDETTAVVTQIAVEAIYARLGMKARPLPAMEVFASKHSRQVATTIAIENIGDGVKRIWEAILKALKMVWEKIQGFVKSFKENTDTLEKRLEQLKVQADSVDKNKMHEVSHLLSKPVPGFFRSGGESNHKTLAAFLDSVDSTIKLAYTLSGITERAVSNDFAQLKADNALADELFKVIKQSFNEKLYSEVDAVVLFGNFVNSSHFEIDRAKASISLVTAKQQSAKETECLPASFIKDVITDIEKSLNQLKEFNKLISVQEKVNKASQKAVEDFINGQTDKEFAERVKRCINTSNFIVTTAPSVTFRTIKVMIDYVDASIKHFK